MMVEIFEMRLVDVVLMTQLVSLGESVFIAGRHGKASSSVKINEYIMCEVR